VVIPCTGDRQGCRAFLERSGLIPTWRNPGPRLSPDAYRSHTTPLLPPYPEPVLELPFEGCPQPDRDITQEFP
jgi:hypothetical protein